MRTTADLLAEHLHAAGVRHIFGYPGESVVEFIEASRQLGLDIVAATREGSAAFMAEGAAMATGSLGVCLSTLGPGSTALLAGVAAATLDRVPVLAISGQIETSREQFFTHQVVNQESLFAPVTKLACRLDPASADTVIRKVLRTATAERPGAVHLTVSSDAFPTPAGPADEVTPPPLASSASTIDMFIGAAAAGDPLTELRAARRPIIVAGIAATRCEATTALIRLAELAGIPVVVAPMAKGVFPEDHPYFAGVLDMAGHRVIWDLLAASDLIISAGFDPVELISPWRLKVPVLHADTTPNTDQVYASQRELVGNVAAIIDWIAAHWSGEPRWTGPEVAQHRTNLRAAYLAGHAAGKLNPTDVVETVRAATPPQTVITTDVGSHKIVTGQAWQASQPRSVLMSNGLSAMGFGVPGAIGAALARPGTPVVGMVGDGGFAMAATELRIAAARNLPVVMVVFSDGSLNRIELHQQSMGYPPSATRVAETDLAALAEAMDCDGVRVESAAALEKALAGIDTRTRPLVIEARIDPSQYEAQF